MYNAWQAWRCSNLIKNTEKETPGSGKGPAQGQLNTGLGDWTMAPCGGSPCPAVRTPEVRTQHLPLLPVPLDSVSVRDLNKGHGDVDSPVTWETPQQTLSQLQFRDHHDMVATAASKPESRGAPGSACAL